MKWVQSILCRDGEIGTACKPSMKAWSLILGQGCVFLSFFKLSYYITYMHRISYCMKKCFFQTNTNCLVRSDSTPMKMACLAKCYPFCVCVCTCVCDFSGVTLTLRTKTTSPAGSQPQVLLEIKQEISALWNKHTQVSHTFWLPVLLPAAACNHLAFCTFFLLPQHFSHQNIRPSRHTGATEPFQTVTLKRRWYKSIWKSMSTRAKNGK